MEPTNRTSMPNIAPAIGVPKTEAKPPLMPQMTNFFRSTSENLKMSEKNEASPAPICAHGPSFPALPPNARVMTVVTSFTGTTIAFILPERLCTASMTFSVPCPPASGARKSMTTVLTRSATGRRR